MGIVDELQDTTVDLVVAGHTHRAANTMVGRIPVVEGFNAGISYSVAQLMVRRGDVRWTGAATRTGQEPRRRPAARRAGDRRQGQRRHGAAAQRGDRQRRRSTSCATTRRGCRSRRPGQPRRRRDARRSTPSRATGRDHELRRPARRHRRAPPTAGEQPGEITWGEAFAVLPFGNRDGDRDAHLRRSSSRRSRTGSGRRAATCPAAPGRTPQFSGLWVEFHCNGTVPVIDKVWLAPAGPRPTTAPLGAGRHDPHRHQRLHVRRWRRLHGARGRHGRAADRRPPARRADRRHRGELAGRPRRRAAAGRARSASHWRPSRSRLVQGGRRGHPGRACPRYPHRDETMPSRPRCSSPARPCSSTSPPPGVRRAAS